MKIGAGIVGILVGLSSILYVGVFGGILGHAAGWLGSSGAPGNSLSNWGEMVSTLSWLAPLLAIVGGIITFSSPQFGAVILASSAFAHWFLLGFGTIGNVFVLPIGAAAVLALFALPSTPRVTRPSGRGVDIALPETSPAVTFDQAKWNALVQYDKDIALMAEKLRPLGQKWLDEFASSYLALTDKQYLPEIERKIVAAAKVEADENEQARLRKEEELTAYLQEQERLAQERKRQLQLRRDRLWGNRKAKIRTITVGSAVFLVVALIVGGILVRQRNVERTALFVQAVARDDWAQVLELIEKGVDVNAAGAGDQTPLTRALIDSNSDSNSGDKASLDAAKSLIEHGADVNVRDDRGATPLHYAYDPAIVSLLLSRGAAVDAKNKSGETPLSGAACQVSSEKANQLIASHADVNVQSDSGDTPLHRAASCGSLLAAKALIEHGAQVNVTNQKGMTPLGLTFSNPEIVAYLKAHGATGDSPLSTLTEQRKKPAYNAVFMTLFSGRFDVPSWLRESGYRGVEHYGRVVAIGGTKYEIYSVCKPHDCRGNFLYVLFTPGGRAGWALTMENSGNSRFYGNPDQGMQAFLTNEAQWDLEGKGSHPDVSTSSQDHCGGYKDCD